MLQVSEAASSTPVSRRQPLKTAQWDILESSVSLMYEAGRPKPVLCDNLEGLGGEGTGRGGSGWKGHMYTYGRFICIAETITVL